MAVVFKYKESLNRTYAPGYTKSGIDGATGKQGSAGNAVYYIKNNIDNSYDVKSLLQKVESNLQINESAVIPLANGREYLEGDIFISNKGGVYQLVKSSEESLFNNFKFDIKEIGKIRQTSAKSMSRVTMFDLSGCKVFNGKTAIKYYDSTNNKIIPWPDTGLVDFYMYASYPIYIKNNSNVNYGLNKTFTDEYVDSSYGYTSDGYRSTTYLNENETVLSSFNNTINIPNFVHYNDPLDSDYIAILKFIKGSNVKFVYMSAFPAYVANPSDFIRKTYNDEISDGVDLDSSSGGWMLTTKYFISADDANVADESISSVCIKEYVYSEIESIYIDVESNKIYYSNISGSNIKTVNLKNSYGTRFYFDYASEQDKNHLTRQNGMLCRQKELIASKVDQAELGAPIKSYSTNMPTCLPSYRTEKPYALFHSSNDVKVLDCSIFDKDTSTYKDVYIHYADYDLAGDWIKMIGEADTPPYNEFSALYGLDGIGYSFSIDLNNTKQLSLDSTPVSDDNTRYSIINTEGDFDNTYDNSNVAIGYSVEFDKRLEFPDITCVQGGDLNDGWASKKLINLLFKETAPEFRANTSYALDTVSTDVFNAYPAACTTVYLSDFTMDDLHPSGNEIKCTIDESRNMWFKSGVNSEVLSYNIENGNENCPPRLTPDETLFSTKLLSPRTLEQYKQIEFSDGNSVTGNELNSEESLDENHEYFNKILLEDLNSLQTYGAGMSFTPVNIKLISTDSTKDSSTTTQFDNTWFPQYAIGLNLSGATETDMQNELDKKAWHGFTTYMPSDSSFAPLYNIKDNVYSASSKLGLYGFENAGYPFNATNIIQYPSYRSSYGYTEIGNELTKAYRAKNYKAGNSLYFSGMTNPEDVASNIFRYISDSNNTFTSIYRNIKTREMSTSEVPVLFDTTLKNANVYLWFANAAVGETTEIIKICITDRNNRIKLYTSLK